MAAINVRIQGGDCVKFVSVTNQGALVVSSGNFDLTVFKEINATATAFSFYRPVPAKEFIITGVLAFATKDVSDASDTIITIYQATADDSTTEDKVLLKFGMGKLTLLPLVPLNLLVEQGKFINAKTDDATIFMTIMGYYTKES